MKITFGKYKGCEIDAIIKKDPSYLLWANNNVSFFNLSEEHISLCKSNIHPKCIYSPFDEEEERYELYGDISIYDEAFGLYD